MPLLEVNSVEFHYGEVQALNGATLHIDEGEIVALVGANGAGKTTLMNAISGVYRISAGTISFDGNQVHEKQAHLLPELGLVQVPENRHLFPYLTVEDNLRLGAFAKNARSRSKETEEWIYELLPALQERRKQRAGSMSGGQQQMLAIGRALMAQPRLLMLDEPSLGLAPIIVSQLFELITEIRQRGTTILLVEQNVRHALSICDRGYALQEGQVVMAGTGQGLLNDPGLTDVMLGIAEIART
ncbi:ABC transporter ATP-binding protein [Georgenia sp. SYP-B2076]|uniref:ABC transporter ATP-binding protein n=1 Tax=Georgenia sp. SYP-B2076 TaxID=2495881 RepID=UPI000F8E4141|nr:ABC transporter ATP-binding protein [Georgenia sp. SYP-B2076]